MEKILMRPEFFTEKEMAEILHLCPKCGRPLIPENLPLDAFEWLLRNDPLIYKAYQAGRYYERQKAQQAIDAADN